MAASNWIPLAIAALLLLGALASLTAFVLRARRRPLALALPLAVGALVAWNAVGLNVLSLFTAVTGPGLALVQLLPILVVVAGRRGALLGDVRRGAARTLRSLRALGVPGLLALPLLVLTAMSAARFAPQNWDSMTYHLARVAHWLQLGSVAPFRTYIPRQNAYGPGAEYLILILQGIGRSDALANFVQWGCFALLVWSAPSLARLAGAPRRTSTWFALLVAALPMGLMQSSSTQNDLVASLMAVGLLTASTPFLHARRPRWSGGDLVILGVLGAATFLVKVSPFLVLAPVLLLAVARSAPALLGDGQRTRRLAELALALAVTGVVAGPFMAPFFRGGDDRGRFVYPLTGAWADRAANVMRGIAHHLPVPPEAAARMGIPEEASRAWPGLVLRFHEDFAGNPVQMGLLLALGLLAVARWRRLGALARGAVIAAGIGWILFHLTLKENIWFSRLQTPLFVILPALMAAALPRRRAVGEGKAGGVTLAASEALVPALAVLALAWGLRVAVMHGARPPLEDPPWADSREASYYLLRPDSRGEHELALRVARELGCGRIGLSVTEDSYDYPLTWRAMQQGMATRHVFFDGDEGWPCVVVSDIGIPPLVGGEGWLRLSEQVFASPRAVRARSGP